MNHFIINTPQLQSPSKRVGAFFVWILCWLMWCYLLLPLFTLAGWLMGNHSFTDEMRWFGGYKSLLQLLQIYALTLAALVGLWLSWVIYHFLRQPALIAAASHVVTDAEMCAFYQVTPTAVQSCRQAQEITVYFDAHGHITELQQGINP